VVLVSEWIKTVCVLVVCVLYIYIYIYIERERERERKLAFLEMCYLVWSCYKVLSMDYKWVSFVFLSYFCWSNKCNTYQTKCFPFFSLLMTSVMLFVIPYIYAPCLVYGINTQNWHCCCLCVCSLHLVLTAYPICPAYHGGQSRCLSWYFLLLLYLSACDFWF
jgi:hypothetical protein